MDYHSKTREELIDELTRLNLDLESSKYRALIEDINEVIYSTDVEGIITFISPSVKRLLGYQPEEVIGLNFTHFSGDTIEHLKQRIQLLQEKSEFQNEYAIHAKTGELHWIRFSSKAVNKDGRFVGLTGSMMDITEKKFIELELQKSEETYRRLVETINDVVFDVTMDGTIKYISSSIEKFIKYKPEEMIGQNFLNFVYPDDRPFLLDVFQNNRFSEFKHIEYRCVTETGEIIWVQVSAQHSMQDGNIVGRTGILSDITERKTAELKTINATRLYSVTSHISQAIVHHRDNEGLLKEICRVAVEFGQFRMAWVGFLDEASKLVMPIAFDGFEEGYLSFIKQISVHEVSVGAAPEVDSVTTGKHSVCEDIENDPLLAARREEALKRGYRSFIVLPLRNKDKTVGVFSLYSSQSNYFSPEEVDLLLQIINDINYALEAIEIEKERQVSELNLLKLSRAVAQSPVSIVITNPDGNIEYANPKACETTGYALEELLNKNPRVLKSGETSDQDYKYLWDSISQGNVWRGIFHNKRKNGELYWESSQITPILDANGKIINYVAIKEDITERKATQEALFLSEKRFSQLASQSATVIWEVDEFGLYTYVSPLSQSVWGYSPNELIGKKYFYDLHPEEGRLEFKKGAMEAFAAKASFHNFENQIVTGSGDLIWVSTNGVPILDDEQKLVGYRGADNEITEKKVTEEALKTSEAALNQAQEISNMSSWELDILTDKLSWSKNYFQMMGIPFGTEMKTEFFLERVYPEDLHIVDEQFEKLKQTRESVTYDIRLKLRDNQFRWIRNNIVPVYAGDQLVTIKGVNLDVTNQKLAEDKIRYQNERLNAVIKAIPDLIFIIDKDGYYLEVYASATEKLLIKEDEIIGRNINEAFDESMTSLFMGKIQEVIEHREICVIRYEIALPNSRSTHFEARIAPLDDNKVLILSRDITTQAQKEDEIKKLSLAVEQSPVSIVITDLAANIEYVNPLFEEVTGYSIDEVLGQNTKILKSGKTSDNEYKELWETITAGREWQGEWINKKKNGEFFWESVSISPIHDSTGRITNYLAVKQDITERKRSEEILRQSEEKYRYIFMNNPQPMWIYDIETLAFLEVNQAAVSHYGYSRNEFLAMTLLDIRPKEDYELLRDDVKNTQNKLFDPPNEWRHLKKNGELINVEISAHPLNYNGRNARHILVNDITKRKRVELEIKELNKTLEHRIEQRTIQLANTNEILLKEIEVRKKAQEEITKARNEAESANMAKSEFLSRMSHELRTPMNSILGFAQLLDMGELNGGQRKGVNHILKSGKHLLDLINEVLDISRIEAGRLSLSIEPVQLSGIIHEIIDVIKPQADTRQIRVELIESPSNQFFMKSDRQRLKQILLNLLNNAVKYNFVGGFVAIHTELMPAEPGNTALIRISISDNGIGISKEDLPKLFNPFERIGAEKSSTEGTGLGLSVVKKLIDAMGGNLGVESTPGEGSIFWIELPGCASELESIKNQSLDVVIGSDLSGKAGLILYIEDNPSNVELVEEILTIQRSSIKLITNPNGNEAVNLASIHRPDLILLDLNLPDIHGSVVLKLLQAEELTREIPVVVISADAMPNQIDKLMKAGAKDYLSKPLNVADLLRVIDELITH